MSEPDQLSQERAESRIDEQPERQSNAPRTEQVQEPATLYSDIILFCHPRNVSNLVQSFNDEIKHAAGELPMFVLWFGQSNVLHLGVVVLEWEGPVSSRFLQNLSIDHEIFDYVIYDWTGNADEEAEKVEGVSPLIFGIVS